jgi:hypothetical protein
MSREPRSGKVNKNNLNIEEAVVELKVPEIVEGQPVEKKTKKVKETQ